jgi:protein-tyrosine-phosphatase
MRFGLLLGTATTSLLAITGAFVVTAEPIGDARSPAPVVFVCRNGVAMSVWSAAYFNRLAERRGLRERAISRAALPSFREVPANMVLALALDGFVLGGYRPAVVSAHDTRDAELVIAIDTDLPIPHDATRGERWEGFPPMREEYFASRKALKARVESLVSRLAASARASPPVEASAVP